MSRVKQEIDRTQAGGRIAGNCTYTGPAERFQNQLGHFLKTNEKISSYCQFALDSKVEIDWELVNKK